METEIVPMGQAAQRVGAKSRRSFIPSQAAVVTLRFLRSTAFRKRGFQTVAPAFALIQLRRYCRRSTGWRAEESPSPAPKARKMGLRTWHRRTAASVNSWPPGRRERGGGVAKAAPLPDRRPSLPALTLPKVVSVRLGNRKQIRRSRRCASLDPRPVSSRNRQSARVRKPAASGPSPTSTSRASGRTANCLKVAAGSPVPGFSPPPVARHTAQPAFPGRRPTVVAASSIAAWRKQGSVHASRSKTWI